MRNKMKRPRSFQESHAGQLRALVGDRLLKLPGACVLIEDADGRVLLEQTRGRDDWRLVGGLAEARESLEQCAIREVFEETGLLVKDLEPYGFSDNPAHIGTLPNGHILHSLTMLFHTTRYSGALSIDHDELVDCRWFSLTALPTTLHPRARDFIDAFHAFQKHGKFQII